MKKLLSIFFLAALFLGNSILAEALVICPAVYPCDDDGNLLEEYSNPESACLDYFIGQCLVTKLQISKNLIQACEFEKSDLEATIDALNATERKYQKLKKRLQQLRSAK